ncbi:hypothetical protein [Modestobacter sp. SYSU DS0511]
MPAYTDADLDSAGIASRDEDATRQEKLIVEAFVLLFTVAGDRLRVQLLQALLGRPAAAALLDRLHAVGVGVDALVAAVPPVTPCPDLVVGFLADDGQAGLVLEILVVAEAKAGAADQAGLLPAGLNPKEFGAWPVTWRTASGRSRRGFRCEQQDLYRRGAAAVWVPGNRARLAMRLPADGIEAVAWVVVSEKRRSWVAEGWFGRGWGAVTWLAAHLVFGRGASEDGGVRSAAGAYLRALAAPRGRRPYVVPGVRGGRYAALSRAAVRAWNAALPTAAAGSLPMVEHADRRTRLRLSATGGWSVELDGVALTGPSTPGAASRDPRIAEEFAAWRSELEAAFEYWTGSECGRCSTAAGVTVTADRCGCSDTAGTRWPGAAVVSAR